MNRSSETLEQFGLPVLAKRVCKIPLCLLDFILKVLLLAEAEKRRCGLWSEGSGLLRAGTLLPGSCGHREPSPRPEAIPPPPVPMVEMPWVGLRDEKVGLPKKNCSSPGTWERAVWESRGTPV